MRIRNRNRDRMIIRSLYIFVRDIYLFSGAVLLRTTEEKGGRSKVR